MDDIDATLATVGPRLRTVREELLAESPVTDPRVQGRVITGNGKTMLPLTRRPGGVQAFKMIISAGQPEEEQKSHEGYEWMHVRARPRQPPRLSSTS